MIFDNQVGAMSVGSLQMLHFCIAGATTLQRLQHLDELRLDSASPLTLRPKRSRSAPLREHIVAEHHRRVQSVQLAAGLGLLPPANCLNALSISTSKIHPGGLQEDLALGRSLTALGVMTKCCIKPSQALLSLSGDHAAEPNAGHSDVTELSVEGIELV